MRIHVDHPWSECARYGAPLRAYIRTRRGFWTIALWPGNQTQVYDRQTKRYTDRWAYITFHPHED